MSRYYSGYRRRSYSRSYWGHHQISERDRLSALTGGIDKDIEQIFLNLPSYKLESVLIRYGLENGNSALSYARDTYPKWKSREIGMSGKVAKRLLNLVPSVLDSDTRFELVKKLRDAHRTKITKVNKFVQCQPYEWRTKVAPEVAELLALSGQFQLPELVVRQIRWLADGDCQAAQSLLAAAEQEEAVARLQHLEREFQRIDALIQSVQGEKTVRHTIELPQGSIRISIEEPRKGFWRRLGALLS